MAEAKIQKRNTYTIYDDEGIGTVQIADEVVAIIAGLAATEVSLTYISLIVHRFP